MDDPNALGNVGNTGREPQCRERLAGDRRVNTLDRGQSVVEESGCRIDGTLKASVRAAAWG
jgi:hypothetical protein